MELLNQEYGKVISLDELSAYLGLDKRSLRKYYKDYGGIEVIPKRIVFFENIINDKLKEKLNAKSDHEKRINEVDRSSKDKRKDLSEDVQRRQKGHLQDGCRLGKRVKEEIGNHYNLF